MTYHVSKSNNGDTYYRIKITHMGRRWGTFPNFCLPFIDALEKQLFVKKIVEVGQ